MDKYLNAEFKFRNIQHQSEAGPPCGQCCLTSLVLPSQNWCGSSRSHLRQPADSSLYTPCPGLYYRYLHCLYTPFPGSWPPAPVTLAHLHSLQTLDLCRSVSVTGGETIARCNSTAIIFFFKIGFCNFLLPFNLKILFSNSTLMDISFEASKIKLVNWAGIVGFWRKKY